jgi:predicted nucleic acid-binding protein
LNWALSSPVVVDTDVASFLFDPDPVRAPRYREHVAGRTTYLPFVVLGELLFRVETRRWAPARRARFNAFLEDFVVVESAPDIAQNWAALRVNAMRSGHMVERQDAWIAAVAITLDLPLVTHNAAHFREIPGLQLLTSPD